MAREKNRNIGDLLVNFIVSGFLLFLSFFFWPLFIFSVPYFLLASLTLVAISLKRAIFG